MKSSEEKEGGETAKGSKGLAGSRKMDRRDTIGALVAIVLATAICAEGFLLYEQGKNINTIASQLGGVATQSAAALGKPLSRTDVARSGDEVQVGMSDLVVLDEPSQYVVETRLPDVDPSNVRAELNGRRLRISVEDQKTFKDITTPNGGTGNEEYVAKLERDVVLPGPVNDSGMTSRLENGVFKVTVPKQHA